MIIALMAVLLAAPMLATASIWLGDNHVVGIR